MECARVVAGRVGRVGLGFYDESTTEEICRRGLSRCPKRRTESLRHQTDSNSQPSDCEVESKCKMVMTMVGPSEVLVGLK